MTETQKTVITREGKPESKLSRLAKPIKRLASWKIDDDKKGRVQAQTHLTSERRRRLPSSAFALPAERKYPIEDKAHARNALARVSQHGTSREKAIVRRKVHERFPSIKERRANA